MHMPTTTKGGPSNHWETLDPEYVQPQSDEDVPEVSEVTDESPAEHADVRPKKRSARTAKGA